jgi:hypothetical protein
VSRGSAQVSAPVFAMAGSGSQQVRPAYGQLPLVFEANQGQSDPRVKFLARGSGYGLFLTTDEVVLNVRAAHSHDPSASLRTGSRQDAVATLRMSLVGGNTNPEVAGADSLPGKSNYLIGNDPTHWHRDVPQFARVRYSGVYPGVDLVYYGKQGQLEYDFEVSPGSDPRQVALQFQGADKLNLDGNGDLVLVVNGSQVRLEAPRIYQDIRGERKTISGKFALQADRQVGFEIGDYDRSRALIIDPVLTYSTYLGGGGDESSPSIAVDATLNAYIAGTTTSTDFPPAGTPFQAANKGGHDVFIAKLDPSGTTLLFSTYLGGTGDDFNAGIAIDSAFNIVVTGRTNSNDFPVAGAFQSTQGTAANDHAFVSEVNSSGTSLVYSTYLRGTGIDVATGVAVDVKNKIYVTGSTTSADFPVTPGAFQVLPAQGASSQIFLSKIDPVASANASLLYSTYFGGSNPTNGVAVGGGITIDKNGGIYITGATNFLHTGGNSTTDFPILNAFQSCLDAPSNPAPCPTNVTETDAFVAKLTPSTSQSSLLTLVYSTYVGGSGADVGTGIAVDSGGMAYITGITNSTDIAIPNLSTTIPFQQCLNNPLTGSSCTSTGGATDAFLAKLNNFTSGTTSNPNVTLLYFSYLGGGSNDQGLAIAVDAFGGARITGWTESNNFHVTSSPIQTNLAGTRDAFITRIDTTDKTGTAATHYSTYFGGSAIENGTGIAIDNGSAIYMAGDTTSSDLTTVAPIQSSLKGSSDAFVTKLGGTVNLAITGTASPTPSVGVGNAVTFKYTITNNGDPVSGFIVTAPLPSGLTSAGSPTVSPSGSCGTSTANNQTILTCTGGGLNGGGTATGTVTFTLTPTAGGSLTAPASVTVPGSTFVATTNPPPTTTVNDFTLDVTPDTQPVVAGSAVTYTAKVTPMGAIPNSVSLTCSSLPTGASCSVTNGAITDLKNNSPQTRAIVVNTTARVTTTVEVRHPRVFYAIWLSVSGLAFLGIGGTMSRKRRVLMSILLGGFVVFLLLLPGCGSSKKTTTTVTGTPAGRVSFNITATSGSATHSKSVTLDVQ